MRRGLVAMLLATASVVVAGCSSDDGGDTAITTTAPVTRTAEVVSETEVLPLYRQGLAKADGGWIFSFNNALFRTDDELLQTLERTEAIPAEWTARGFNHLGDIDVVDGLIYAPLEQPDYDIGRQAMLVYDAATLDYREGVDVDQHHNSFVTIDPSSGIAYTMDYFGGDALLRYDVRDGWRALDPLPMSRFVDRVQGGDVFDGAVWLSTDDEIDGVYRVDLGNGVVDELGSIGRVDGEGEGIDATPLPTGDLHVLTIDRDGLIVRLVQLVVSDDG